MKNQQYLITVSIDEFACLHDSGQLRVDWNRIVAVGAKSESTDVATSLLMRLPEFLERDEHNILILLFQIAPGKNTGYSACTRRTDFRHLLNAEDCLQVIPATSQAKSILTTRFGGKVLLEEPAFESFFEEDFRHRHLERSLRGAFALVKALLESEDYQIPSELLRATEASTHNPNDLWGKLLNYQRNVPMSKEPVSGLRDLGRVLNSLPENKPIEILTQLSEWLKPIRDTAIGFKPLYSDQSLDPILGSLTAKFDLPTHAASCAIYLHWKDLALSAGGLDLSALEEDCRLLAGFVPGSRIVDAIWMLGFTAGYETFASEYYARLDSKHPFGGGKIAKNKVPLLWPETPIASQLKPQTPRTPELVEDQKPVPADPPSMHPATTQEETKPEAADELKPKASEEARPDSAGVNEIITPENEEPQSTEIREESSSPVAKKAPKKAAKKTARSAKKQSVGKAPASKRAKKPTPNNGDLFDK